MKRLDEGKVSLVDFLRSIKFTRRNNKLVDSEEDHTHFADFNSRARTQKKLKEERYLVRSAN